MILINGLAENRIDVVDRGLQYGDGLFETIPYRAGRAEFLDAHFQRLKLGCERLQIPFTQFDLLQAELTTACQQLNDDAVIKVIITRGSGGRGYFSDKQTKPTRIISTHSYPTYPSSNSQQGISVRLCRHKLSENPTLAGIKHLNRLDQVLARNEWNDDVSEGLMSDQNERIIEGTMSNVFVVKSGMLITPLLRTSGVSGIIRQQIIRLATKQNITVKEVDLTRQDLQEADEVFVCNSVIGIWPVIRITDLKHSYPVGPVTKQCQNMLLRADK
mgnify:CR=1 FL=1